MGSMPCQPPYYYTALINRVLGADVYTYSGVMVNGVVKTGNITVTASGSTITIQGVFIAT